MKDLLTHFSKLSLDNGSRMTRDWLDFASAIPRKFFALLFCLLFIGVGNAWGTEYTYKSFTTSFVKGSTNGTSVSTQVKTDGTTKLSTISNSNDCFTTNPTTVSNTYYNSTGVGLRISKSSGAGSIKFTLTDALKDSTIYAIVVYASKVSGNNKATLVVTPTAPTGGYTTITNIANGTLKAYSGSYGGTNSYYKLDTIKVGGKKINTLQFGSASGGYTHLQVVEIITQTEKAAGCSNNVGVTKGTENHGEITTISSASVATCSATASDRRVTITVTPDDCYDAPSTLTWTKSSGTVSASKQSGPTDNGDGTYSYVYQFAQNDNGAGTFGVTCTAKAAGKTVNFDAGPGSCLTSSLTETCDGSGVTLPAVTATGVCKGWTTFAGWATAAVSDSTTTSVTVYAAGSNFVPASDGQTLYAVYSKAKGGSGFKLSLTVSSTTYYVGKQHGSDNYLSAETNSANAAIFTFDNGYLSYDDSGTKKYISITGNNTSLYTTTDKPAVTWTESGTTTYTYLTSAATRYLAYNGSANPVRFASYNNNSSYPQYFTKTSAATTYYCSDPNCCTALGTINGSINWNNPTEAEVTWDIVDHVDSWTLKYKVHGAGAWTTAFSSKTASDSEITEYDSDDDDTDDRNKATITGLTCNTAYDFQIIANPASGYCDKDETLDNSGSGYNSGKYAITLTGGGDITGGVFTSDPEEECASEIITLEAAPNTGYEFTNWEITYTDSGDDAWEDVNGDDDDLVSDGIYIEMPAADITVNAVFSCVEPVIGTQPSSASYIKDASPTALSVSATLSSGTLTYLWKVSTNGGSTWSDAGGTNNTASYLGSSLSTSSTGTLKFKCIVGNSEGGCTVESNVATITINAGSTWKFKYSGDSYTEHTMTESDGVASYSISLAADTRFEFCIDDNGTAYKNNGTIITTTSGWVFNTSDNNCKIHTGPAGTYTFAINTTSKAVTVTYPTVDHPNDHYVYFKNTNVWGTVYGYLANSGNDNKAAAWPGSVMSATTTICGETYHYAALNAMSGTYNTIIFNNGNSGYGNQTSDLSTTSSLGKYNANSDAAWHQFKYAISFDKGTGSGDAMSSIENLCPGSNQALTANTYTKEHNTFAGWIADVDVKVGESTIDAGEIIDDEVTIKDIQSDINLTAQWTPNTYTITKTLTNVANAGLPASFTYTGATTTALNSTFTVNTTNFFLPSSIAVTMGGTPLTAGTDYTYNNSTGAFTFSAVITGDIVITATATAKLMSIAITTAPTKTAYFAGETFSATGAVVTATMGDGTTKAVSGSATWTPTGALTAESGKTMTATYTEAGITKTATTTINVYAVTMQAKDESGDAIAVGGPGAPSRSVTSISPAADAGNYVFKQWTISGASLGSSATTKSNTITTPTGAVTVTAVYYKPRVIKWSVNNDDSYEEGTPTLAVAYNTAISAVPTAPDDDALNNCANKFMGWSTTNITKGSPVTAADDIAALGLFTNASGYTTKITAATTTFYAVFAEKTVVRDEGYYKVTSTGDITNDGRYLIVNETSEVVFDGSLDVPDAGENVVSISDKISAGAITVDDDNRENLANAEFTIDMTNKYVKSHSNQYIYQDTYSNGMSYSSEPAEVQSISIDGSGNLVIEGKGQNKSNPYDYVLLRWNSTTGSTNWRFRFYKGTQNPIQLYAYDLGYSYTNYVTQCADNQVRVTYDFKGGTGTACTEGVTTKSASYSVCSTEPEKDYYNFAGWNDGTSTYDAGDTYDLQATTEFEAQWTATEYSITYNLNDGTQQESPAPATSYTYESSDITLPTAPTKGHSRFDGWFDNSGLTGSAVTTIAAGSHGDTTLYAKWTDRHTIVFDADGSETTIYRASDEALNASLAGQGSVPDDPDAPGTCSSKVFMGWTETEIYDYSNSAPADLMNTYTGTVRADKHYYAVWATRSGSLGSYTYSAYATTCCDNHITLSSPTITGSGTVVFAPVSPAEASPDGTYATCRSNVDITATVTPASGYTCTSLSFTRNDSEDIDIDPTISGNLPSAPSAQDFVLSFDKNTDVTVTTAATFTAKGVTGWTWKQELANSSEITIPAVVDLYCGQRAVFNLKEYAPSDVISDNKGYSVTKDNTYLSENAKAGAYYKVDAKSTAVASTTLTFTSTNNSSVEEIITVRITALPTATFVDNIHNKTDFTTGDAALPASGILSATIDGTDKRIVYLTQKTPNHADVAVPGSGNDCEKSHLHLVGWIDADWADEHPDADHDDIVGAGSGVFYAPNADIDLSAKNGKTFLAVWSKIE